MARNFHGAERSRKIEISIPGYSPEGEVKKINERFKRIRDKKNRRQQATDQQRKRVESQRRDEEETQIAELNAELATRMPATAGEIEGKPPCSLFE